MTLPLVRIVLRAIKRSFYRFWLRLYSDVNVIVYNKRVKVNMTDCLFKEVPDSSVECLDTLTPFMRRERYFVNRKNLLEQRFAKGDKVIVFYSMGSIVHVDWVGMRQFIVAIDETGPDCRLELNKEELLIYDCWTKPSMRGRGHYTAALKKIPIFLGYTGSNIWIYCVERNKASRHAIEKAGFRRIAKFTRKVRVNRVLDSAVIKYS
jgi:hypothetical protein